MVNGQITGGGDDKEIPAFAEAVRLDGGDAKIVIHNSAHLRRADPGGVLGREHNLLAGPDRGDPLQKVSGPGEGPQAPAALAGYVETYRGEIKEVWKEKILGRE